MRDVPAMMPATSQRDMMQGAHWGHYLNSVPGMWLMAARGVRFINILFSARVIVAPWLLLDAVRDPVWIIDVAVGAELIVLSLPRDAVYDRYGVSDRYAF